jgi:hypothetical protein
MSDAVASGPSSTATWSHRSLTLDDGAEATVLTVPDVSGGITYVLPPAPRLVHGPGGAPLLSLSLILSSQPGPDAESAHSLIEGGVLTMDVQIGVAQAVLDALAAHCAKECRRLFARRVEYALLWVENDDEPPRILARAEGGGTEGRAGIRAHLDRAQSLDVLGALDRTSARLRLCATVHYRGVGPPQVVRLSGSWERIHDFLAPHADEQGRLTEAALQRLIPSLAEEGLLAVTHGDGSPTQLSAETLVRLFMRQAVVLLRRDPDAAGDEVRYTLRARPHKSFRLSYSESIAGSELQTQELCAPLERLVGGVLEDRNWDDHVHLVARQADNPALVATIPRRVRATPGQRATRGSSGRIKVAVIGNTVAALSLATRPNTTATSQPALTVVHQPEIALAHTMLDDIRVELPQKDRPRSLPIIHNPNAPYWHDRLSRRKIWYAPVFELVEPAPNADPASSPFLFSFERIGVTGTGAAALRGRVRFTLRQVMSEETSAALRRDARGDAHPVPLDRLSVSLLVPFVNTTDGQVRQHRFAAAVEADGDTVTATVLLLNEWVRLCYGALAMEDFQTLPAQIQVAYTFSGYVPIKEGDLELTFGGKALHTPVVYSAAEAATLRGATFFDATTLTYVQPRTEVRYRREAAGTASRHEGRAERAAPARPLLAAGRPLVATPTAVRPQLSVAPNLAALLRKVEYARRTQVRRQTQTIFLPCNRLGRFYQEVRDSTPTAIGCQDALTLGQTRYRQYEEIAELRTPAYQVYRSLQQPGHFLVLPTRFCISRRAANEADAYRPLIFLHALLDAEVPANNRVELRTTLQPDLPPFERRALLERLKAYDPEPVIHYPTDIPTEAVAFTWALDPAITADSEASILDAGGPFISTYFRMDLPSWQLMRSVLNSPGIRGSVSFTLADGSQLSANLLLKLDHIRGPWESGPLEVTANDDQLRLTNRIERTVEVSDLVRYAGPGVAQQVPVEVSLAAGQTHTVATGGGLQPVYRYPPGDPVAIEEVRSFVEDIYSNLIFINLLNFANYNLVRLDVEARLQGVEGRYTAQLTEAMPVADIPIVLPLTTYLERHVLEFRVTKVFSHREAQITDWMQWDLDTTVPVSLTRELLDL